MDSFKKYTFTKENRGVFKTGFHAGIPIGLGYFAVSFSLGIAAKSAGLTPFQGFLASLLTNASAGEYAGFRVIAENAPYWEMIFVILITNARYLLMSCALSQRMSADLPFIHRFFLGFYITDEFFGISIARPGLINPYYTYGAVSFASPCWAVGTMLGIIAGNLLPVRVVSALSVSLFGMFLAIFIPPCKKSLKITLLVIICFAASYAFSVLPAVRNLSEGTRTIILTVVIAGLAALFCPVDGTEAENDA